MSKTKTEFVSSRIPLYYQLENVLREKISSGAFLAGVRMPTEVELTKEYGVSRITVRQALQALTDEGLIERQQGRGTFIANRKTRVSRFTGTIHLTGSLDELIAMGMDTPVKVLEMNLVEADQHEAGLLQLPLGTRIYRLKRLRLNEGIANRGPTRPLDKNQQIFRLAIETQNLTQIFPTYCLKMVQRPLDQHIIAHSRIIVSFPC